MNLLLILSLAILLGWGCHKFQLPPLLGYLVTGFLAGPELAKNLGLSEHSLILFFTFDQQDLGFTPFIRSAALMIILLRAGLQLKWQDLKSIGRPAILLSVLPLALEVLAVYHLSMVLFSFSATEASILAFCIAAVSPAVIVPSMLQLIRSGEGMNKRIPVMILAGASLDDVIALAGFSAMLALAQNTEGWNQLASTPLALLLGFIGGGVIGVLFYHLTKLISKSWMNTVIALALSSIMVWIEKNINIPFSSVLAIMSFGFFISKHHHDLANEMGHVLKLLWKPAELALFVTVGAQVAPSYLIQAGWVGVLIILLGCLARSVGVWLSLVKTNFNPKEKLFCALAYLPKATVQAAIGGIALQFVSQGRLTLENGLGAGEMILALSVMSIAITAPLGAIAIHKATPLITNET